jgi:hypothetical protein
MLAAPLTLVCCNLLGVLLQLTTALLHKSISCTGAGDSHAIQFRTAFRLLGHACGAAACFWVCTLDCCCQPGSCWLQPLHRFALLGPQRMRVVLLSSEKTFVSSMRQQLLKCGTQRDEDGPAPSCQAGRAYTNECVDDYRPLMPMLATLKLISPSCNTKLKLNSHR